MSLEKLHKFFNSAKLFEESRRGFHMLPYFLINVGQLVFWLRYIYDISGVRNGQWNDACVPATGKPGIFQCNEFLNIDGKIQYDSAFLPPFFFFFVWIVHWETEYRLEKTEARGRRWV